MKAFALATLVAISFEMPKGDIEGGQIVGLLTPTVYCYRPPHRARVMAVGEPGPPLARVSMFIELDSGAWACFVTVTNRHGIESKPGRPAVFIVD